MPSYQKGKQELQWLIKRSFKKGSSCLDVGACDGEYFNLLGDHLDMDACEVFQQNIVTHGLREKYHRVWNVNIKDLKYDHYDIVIFGDVIEHMTIEDAQAVLEYAKAHSDFIVVAVPYMYKQGAIYGNPYEIHIQDDLTENVFMERYPGFELKFPYPDYGYWIWEK